MTELDGLHLDLDAQAFLRERARLAFAWNSFEKAVKRAAEQVRRDLQFHLEVNGVERQGVTDAHGNRAGTIAWSEGRTTAKVTDAAALADWVAEHYPTEVHTVTVVRERFVQQMLDAAVAEGVAVDSGTGEVIPGIGVTTGEPFIRITEARTGDKLGDRLLDLALDRTPALTEGI